MEAIAGSLGLAPDYFSSRYTADPLILFRIFLYPSRPVPADVGALYGVGEHTDYGLLTLVRQDTVGGLPGTSINSFVRRIVSSRGARNPHVPGRTFRLLRSGLLTLHPQK